MFANYFSKAYTRDDGTELKDCIDFERSLDLISTRLSNIKIDSFSLLQSMQSVNLSKGSGGWMNGVPPVFIYNYASARCKNSKIHHWRRANFPRNAKKQELSQYIELKKRI